jgi:hypothetical protein
VAKAEVSADSERGTLRGRPKARTIPQKSKDPDTKMVLNTYTEKTSRQDKTKQDQSGQKIPYKN